MGRQPGKQDTGVEYSRGGLPTLPGGDGGLSRRGLSVLRHEEPGGRGGGQSEQSEGGAEQRPDPRGENLGKHRGCTSHKSRIY